MPTADATHNTDINALHRQAIESTRTIIAAIGANQWSNPTPCADWNVRDLVNHVVTGNLWAAELANGRNIADVGDRLDGDQLGDSALQAFDDSASAAIDAFATPGALEAACAVSYGPVPGATYAGHRFIDVLVHGHDLAVATGQKPALSMHLVEAAWEIIEPQLSGLQASGMFGSAPDHPPSSEPQRRLLEALGRNADI
jgi:uncharacterized protein (TIGR03086 family)